MNSNGIGTSQLGHSVPDGVWASARRVSSLVNTLSRLLECCTAKGPLWSLWLVARRQWKHGGQFLLLDDYTFIFKRWWICGLFSFPPRCRYDQNTRGHSATAPEEKIKSMCIYLDIFLWETVLCSVVFQYRVMSPDCVNLWKWNSSQESQGGQ